MTLASIWARCCPMQLRDPDEKGRKVNGAGDKVFHRDGRNRDGDGKVFGFMLIMGYGGNWHYFYL